MTDSQQKATAEHVVVVPDGVNMVSVLGPGDEHLDLIERAFEAAVHVRGNRITLDGEPGEVALAERLLDEMVTMIRTGQGVTPETVERIVAMLRTETTERPADVLSLNILSNRGRTIRPKTIGQKLYLEAITRTPSSSASARPARARPTSPWPWPSRRCRPSRSTASS